MMRRRAGTPGSSMAGRRLAVLVLGVALVVGGPASALAAGRQGAAPRSSTAAAIGLADPIGDLALDLAYDPDAIFRFVADEIRYEPYPGILRGARGTLAAGAGNSVDKALLLGALLDASQVGYRFARGPIDPATAAALLDSLVADPEVARQQAREPLVRGLEQVDAAGAALRPDDAARVAEVEAAATAAEEQAATLLGTAASRLDGTVAMLDDALGSAGVELASDVAPTLPATETAGHTWVQMAVGPDWLDMDPTMAGAQPGAPLTSAAETLTTLPDDLRHRIEIGVLVESVSGGQLATHEVLTWDGFADALAETPITFAQAKPSGLKALGTSLGDLLGGGWIEYRPAVFTGTDRVIADRAVAFPSGEGSDPLGVPASGAPAGPVDGEATAEWLEVRVTPPGLPQEVARRTVFDRLPAELRAAGTLDPSAIAPVELSDDGTGSMEYLPMLGVRTFAIATGPTSAASVAAAAHDPLGTVGLAFHAIRDAIGSEAALDAGARTFIDGPNIVAFDIDRVDPATDTLRMGLDIWRRDHGILPLTGSSAPPAPPALVAGVLDHVAERAALEGLAGDPEAPATESGVGAIFEAAASQGVDTVVLQAPLPDALPYGPEASRLIREAVEAGDAVIVPAQPVTLDGRERLGWWRVDPRTGAAADVMDDGAGQSAGEYVVIVDEELGTLACEGMYARRVAYIIWAAASIVGAYGLTDIYWLYEDGYAGLSCSVI